MATSVIVIFVMNTDDEKEAGRWVADLLPDNDHPCFALSDPHEMPLHANQRKGTMDQWSMTSRLTAEGAGQEWYLPGERWEWTNRTVDENGNVVHDQNFKEVADETS